MERPLIIRFNTALQLFFAILIILCLIGYIFSAYFLMLLLYVMPIVGISHIILGIIFLVTKLPHRPFLIGYFVFVIIYFVALIFFALGEMTATKDSVVKFLLFPTSLLGTLAFWYHSYQLHKNPQ
ncbi:MAG TPA: hypothetical protein DCE41_15685 [Cytophagales bacterium]|nr:hypothetical protein [Cytophagales bacterium]HAA24128.1 hypothetical protein [Cytophagales bacterium]HAP58728.1 hypothetical protein [Cytophagales bacterium]